VPVAQRERVDPAGAFSVTTSERPSGATETWAAPFEPAGSAVTERGRKFALPSTENAATLGVPPWLSTYAVPSSMSIDTGSVPPLGTRPTSVRCPRRVTWNAATSLEPASAASTVRPSSESATAPWEPRPALVPVPPVRYVATHVSEPSGARSSRCTALPEAEFVSV
jgi:hypothetical protein